MEEMNEYEADRARRIAENRAKMASLGLLDTSAAATLSAGTEKAPRLPKARKPAPSAPTLPFRESKRLRGQAAPGLSPPRTTQPVAEQAAKPGKSGGASRKPLELPQGVQFAAPFSLRSIATTVWELGTVHRGPWAQRYWSSSGCTYHHAYPVGYRATKIHFGRSYEMRIEAGASGPVFSVTDTASGVTFRGISPTRPWTDVCVAHKTGQRISGPLFFGFSDKTTQQAIAAELYSPQELAAALAGEKVAPEELTPAEAAARDFMRLEGVGEATGIAMAHTLALGGRQHSGVAAIAAWVKENKTANAAALLEWLLHSEEVPASSRNWPAWKKRVAAGIVAAVAGGAGREGNAAETEAESYKENASGVGGWGGSSGL